MSGPAVIIVVVVINYSIIIIIIIITVIRTNLTPAPLTTTTTITLQIGALVIITTTTKPATEAGLPVFTTSLIFMSLSIILRLIIIMKIMRTTLPSFHLIFQRTIIIIIITTNIIIIIKQLISSIRRTMIAVISWIAIIFFLLLLILITLIIIIIIIFRKYVEPRRFRAILLLPFPPMMRSQIFRRLPRTRFRSAILKILLRKIRLKRTYYNHTRRRRFWRNSVVSQPQQRRSAGRARAGSFRPSCSSKPPRESSKALRFQVGLPTENLTLRSSSALS